MVSCAPRVLLGCSSGPVPASIPCHPHPHGDGAASPPWHQGFRSAHLVALAHLAAGSASCWPFFATSGRILHNLTVMQWQA